MFKRRVPKTFILKMRDFFWPRLGWRRSGRLYALKLYRLQGSAGAIAAGFACGAAVSILPMVGFHFLLAAALAWALRGNIIASAIGTVVGNPWTFPFIWVASWHTGNFLLGGQAQSVHHLDFADLFHALWQGVVTLDGPLLMQGVWPVWWPMFVGSLPWAVVTWLLFYLPIKRVLASYDRLRTMRRLERLAALTGGQGTAREAEK
ncbi:DUF2062 domain-containing protein [Caenispirillum bisanense]|uniref:DUF2062 domain-containing protein n=1 Tax=Caenispirillum bisanense TaxID=414052 RepID=A0A286GFN8_9PROT|nr:DUF2062 domain-containing protein [Caenispirillum bisanense]SOD94345.1 hypothetical protein SAMN05421508_103477 [Caenispirillum bisanense]